MFDLRYMKGSHLDYRDLNVNCFVNNVKYNTRLTSALWHFRLGHSPNKWIRILSNRLPYISCNEHICDICHYSKQKKLPYVYSDNNVANSFDLIHVRHMMTLLCSV